MKHTRGATGSGRLRWRTRAAAVALAVGGLAVVGAPGLAGAATTSATATEISTTSNAKLGTILVAGDNAVYTLKGKKCTGSCLKAQPPVLLPAGVTAATAGTGVDAAKLGTVKTSDGSLQITYAGKPLYWSAKDTASGQVHSGHNKFGTWTAVVTAKASSGTKSPSTTGAGNGGVGF